MARTFNGSGQSIDLNTGAYASSAWDWGTVAFIIRKAANGTWQTILSMGVSTTDSIDIEFSSGNQLYYAIDSSPGFTNFANQGSYSASGWMCVVLTKATGAATPRAHVYDYAAGTWAHNNFHRNINAGTRTGHDSIFLGRFPGQTTSTLNGDLAIAALYRHWDPTDAEVEAMGFQWSLGAWLSAANKGDRAAVWLLDQAATSTNVIDLTGGGAGQWGGTAPSIASQSVPGFGYMATVVPVRRALVVPSTGSSFTDTVDINIVATTPSTDLAAFVDNNQTVITGTTPSTDTAQRVDDNQTVITATTPSTDLAAFVDNNQTVITATTPSTDTAQRVDDNQTVITATTPSTDTAQRVDTTDTTIVGTTPSSDVAAWVDEFLFTINATVAVDDEFTGAATDYTDDVLVTIVATTMAQDVLAATDEHTTAIVGAVPSTDTLAVTEVQATTIVATTPSTDTAQRVDDNLTTITAQTPSTDLAAFLDIISHLVLVSTPSTDQLAMIGAHTTNIVATLNSTDVYVSSSIQPFVIMGATIINPWGAGPLKHGWLGATISEASEVP